MYNHIDYCLPGETWRPIPDYEGIYEASDFGRIRSVEGKVTDSVRHGRRRWRGRILKTRGSNYTTGHRVSLWKDKVSRDYLVARLIGVTFLGIPDDPKMTINHIDGNRFNNQLSNLGWLSLADNIRHAFATGLMPHAQRIKLLSNFTVHEFDSLSKASTFIGRNEKYISSCLIRGVPIRDENGEVVEKVA